MSTPAQILARFEALARAPMDAQADTLARLVDRMKEGAFGREHRFQEIRTIDDLRRRVPIRSYEEFRPWIEGDPASLTGEAPLALLRTSGTSGKQKLIPCTHAFRGAIKAAHDVFTSAIFRELPELPMAPGERPMALGLYQLGRANEEMYGLPLDAYISQLFSVALEEDPFFRGVPPEVYRIDDMSERLFAMALTARGWDLRAIRATNPTTLLLFARVVRERLDRSPRELWPNLSTLITWRGGACSMFEPFLAEAYPGTRIRSLLFGSSEGVIALPIDPSMRGGVPALTSCVFEFRRLGDDSDDTLTLAELEVGARYELIFSSFSGLVRYAIGDIVEVEGRFDRCPTIAFVARKGRTSSLTGEKLTELQVEDAVAGAARELGVRIKHFVLSPELADVPWYVLSIEWADAPPPSLEDRLAAAVERSLDESNIEYRAKRSSGRLGAVRAYAAAEGEFERVFAERAQGGINAKLPHLAPDPFHRKLKPRAH